MHITLPSWVLTCWGGLLAWLVVWWLARSYRQTRRPWGWKPQIASCHWRAGWKKFWKYWKQHVNHETCCPQRLLLTSLPVCVCMYWASVKCRSSSTAPRRLANFIVSFFVLYRGWSTQAAITSLRWSILTSPQWFSARSMAWMARYKFYILHALVMILMMNSA